MKLNIVTITTFFLFTFEAMIHYNIGRSKENEKFVLHIPSTKEFLKIA